MPQITQFIARNNSEYLVNDDFNRQDGVLQTLRKESLILL